MPAAIRHPVDCWYPRACPFPMPPQPITPTRYSAIWHHLFVWGHVEPRSQNPLDYVALPIHPSLQELLKELRPKQGSVDSYLLPDVAEEYQRNPTAISRRIREHFENCGIQTVEESGSTHRRNAIVRVGFHSLRHSFVSLCAGKGVPEVALMELVGHGSPAMTRLYSHAGNEQKAKAVAALPKIAFAAKGGAE